MTFNLKTALFLSLSLSFAGTPCFGMERMLQRIDAFQDRLESSILNSRLVNSRLFNNKYVACLTGVPLGYWGCMGAHILIAHHKTLLKLPALKCFLRKSPWWRTQQDVDPVVRAFIYQECGRTKSAKEQRLLKSLSIKQIGITGSMFATRSGMGINEVDHTKLLRILLDKEANRLLTPADQDFLDYHAVISRHEFSHIINKDPVRRSLAFPITSIALQSLTVGLAKYFDITHYYKPSHFSDSQTDIELLKGGCFLIGSGILMYLAQEKIINSYAHHQERRADQYAFKNTNDPETLLRFARHKKIHQQEWCNYLIDSVIAEIKTKILKDLDHENVHFKLYSRYLHRIFLKQHPALKKSPYSEETFTWFRAWLQTEQPILNKLQELFDPHHDSDSYRMTHAKKAAKVLEYQKKLAAQSSN